MNKILVAEDDMNTNQVITEFLKDAGYDTVAVYDGNTARDKLYEMHFDLVILDIMLPGLDGFSVCSKIRESTNAHILIASARTEKDDKLKGLNLGADDYMTKPFSPSELVARVKAHTARYERLTQSGAQDNEVVEIRGLKIDKTARRVYVNGEEKQLTTKEFDLLTFLASNPNHVYSKEELFRNI